MKKSKVFSRITSTFLLIVLAATTFFPATAFAAEDNGRYYTTYRTLKHEWQNATDMVDVSFDAEWMDDWIDWFQNTSRNPSFRETVEAAYDTTVGYAAFNYNAYTKYVTYNNRDRRVENVPKEEMAAYLPQYTYSQLFQQVIDYVNDSYRNRSRPEWTEADYARFMVGMLRFQDVPAYIEVGTSRSYGRYNYRVAAVDTANNRIYYCDPARGILSGNTSKWMWLSESEYSDDWKYSHVYYEGNQSVNTVDNPDFTTTSIDIPQKYRFEGLEIPIKKGGRTSYVPMRMIAYDGETYFWVRDIAKILEDTDGEIWVSYNRTLQFGTGDYNPSGTEVNWLEGKSITIDKTSPAYLLSHAYFNGKRVKMDVIILGDTLYAKPNDITDEIGIKGLGINVKVNW